MTTLVVYGSKYGSTKAIAHEIADVLAHEGLAVEVRTPEQHPDLALYDAVVLGSAVYAGRWRRNIRSFLRTNSKRLSELPVWIFSVGPLGDPPTPREPPHDASAAVESLDARGQVLFAGAVDSAHLSFGDHAVVKALNVPDGDYRNWDAIRHWSHEVAADLVLSTTDA